jgi:hypothetical protein
MKVSDLKVGYARLNAGELVGGLPFPMFENVKLRVRRIWNAEFSALHASLIEDGKTDAEAFDECLVSKSLVGWEGIDDAYTPETGKALLADTEVGGVFRSAVIFAATQLGTQVRAAIEADEKN